MSHEYLVRGLTSLLVLFVLTSEFVMRREQEAHVEYNLKHHIIATTASTSDDQHRHLPTVENIGAGL